MTPIYVPKNPTLDQIMDIGRTLATRAAWPEREVGTELMLVVTELAEAMEGDRKDKMDDKLPHRPMMEVELADAVIRICTMSACRGYDLVGALVEKLEYNSVRPDHAATARTDGTGPSY